MYLIIVKFMRNAKTSPRYKACNRYNVDYTGNIFLYGKKNLRYIRWSILRRQRRERMRNRSLGDRVLPSPYSTMGFRTRKRRGRRTAYFYKFLYKQRLCRFYANIKLYQFKHLIWNLETRRWPYLSSFLSTLEYRLDSILCRANLLSDFRVARQYIRHFGVLLNGVRYHKVGICGRIGDSITFDKAHRFNLQFNYKKRYTRKTIIINNPPYLEINYKTLSIILLGVKSVLDVYYPFKVEIGSVMSLYEH